MTEALVTGAAGFIGKNLTARLLESGVTVQQFTRGNPEEQLRGALGTVDVVVHLAGENRPSSVDAFEAVNVGLTRRLCGAIYESGRAIPLLLASSTQAELPNPYGQSKLQAEREVVDLARSSGIPVAIYRLPGVFGKWCRPNYNSVVATFCHNIANDLPIQISDPSHVVTLVYIDDVVTSFLEWITAPCDGLQWRHVTPEYSIALGELADRLRTFGKSRSTLEVGAVGSGLSRALYATFVSYLPTSHFAYRVPVYRDSRGVFVEMLKTQDSGQLSFFTAHPGVTRGGHYHHTKTEKFLVLKGKAKFGFRNILSGETFSLHASEANPLIVDTIPGWAHDITNVGDEDLVVMLWSNEVFDRERPDTVASKV